MTFKAYVTADMNELTCFVSQGRVKTSIRIGGQFCCSFVANLLQYPCAKNYGNIRWFDKVIAKIKRVHFLLDSVDLTYRKNTLCLKKTGQVRLI